MANTSKLLGRNRDLPQLESVSIAALTGGSANDGQDTALCTVPVLARSFNPGTGTGIAGELAMNRMVPRCISFISQGSSNTTGNATNNADLQLRLYRSGVYQGVWAYYPLSINTTLGTATTAGSTQTVTPAAMTGIRPGVALYVDASGTNPELVYVSATTATTFTAYFAYAHTTSATVTSVLIPYRPIDFVQTPNASTTASVVIPTGGVATTITPSSVYGFHVGDQITISGAGTYEYNALISAVTGSSVTATFAQAHSGTTNVGYLVATTSATAVTGGTTSAIVVASLTNIVAGQTLYLQGTGADAAKTNGPLTVSSITPATRTVTFSAAIPTNSYSNPIVVSSVAPTTSSTAVTANTTTSITVTSATGIAAGQQIGLIGTGTDSPKTDTLTVLSVNGTTVTFVSAPTNSYSQTIVVCLMTATTTGSTVSAGSQTITVASATNIFVGQSLTLWGGTNAPAETVTISAMTTAGALTVTPANTHSGTVTLTSVSANTLEVREGDVLTFARLSNNSTGIATPAGLLQIDWIPSGPRS